MNFFVELKLLVEHYGNIAMSILLLLEFIALPVPGEPLMAFLGFMTNKAGDSFFLAVLFCIIGTNVGSIIAYYLGYWLGEPLLKKYGKYLFLNDEKITKTKLIMEKYEVVLLLFSRYVPGVRHVVPYLCGITRLPFRKFNFYSVIGSIIWCSSFVGAGFVLGDRWNEISAVVEEYALVTIIVVILLFIIWKLIRKYLVKK